MSWRRRRPKRAAVLGCGPAGLFATHALLEAGWEVSVFSRKRRSKMFGAQYLHAPIPGLPEVTEKIDYHLVGSVADYRRKVYGTTSAVSQVSPDLLVGMHPAWDIRAAYYAAWDRYAGLVSHVPDIGAAFAGRLLGGQWGTVISSLPAHIICSNPRHNFTSQAIWAIGDAPELGVRCPITCAPFTVICNGTREVGWYRKANVFGHTTAEWPYESRPPLAGLAQVQKPIGTNCDCYPEIQRVGRYGMWTKGVLSHQAYERAKELAA